jgi:DNA modification methylase
MLDTKEQRIKIIQGNCVDKIKELEDNSIDCVVSSPPYFGLRDYGNDEAIWFRANLPRLY